MATITIQRNLLAETEQITNAEQLEAVFNNPANERKIRAVREARAKGDMKTANKNKIGLEGLIFIADQFAECDHPFKVGEKDGEDVMEVKHGRWRLQESAHLNGLAVLDVDHLKENPRDLFKKWTVERLRELGVLLVFITSSDAGLKFVFIARKEWGNLIENARRLAQELGEGLAADESGKDACRMSFAPSRQAGDILFYDPERMFSYENPDYDATFGEAYRKGNSKGNGALKASLGVQEFSISNISFRGVPIQKIVDCFIGPVIPEPGMRHKTSLELADQLRYILDSDPIKMEVVLRAQSWIQDIIKERGENVTQTIKSALAFKEEKRIPKRMYNALKAAGVDEFDGLSKRRLPYAEWAKRLLSLTLGCYESAIAYIDDNEIKAGGVITAAGMYGTLLTKCWYQDWEGLDHRINIMSLVIGGPASGKGFAVKQDEYIMEVLREADAAGRELERQYKEGLNERETSQKEQKKDALKRPSEMVRYCPVKTSNNVTYRRMQNATVPTEDGALYYYHLYTFASELLSIIKASGSFQEKRDLMLQSFHNELNGVDYSNKDSVNGLFPVFYNWVMTGTSTALRKFVNLTNIGDGLATRFSCFVMPTGNFKMRPMSKKRKSMEAANEMKKWGQRMDSLHGEIKGLEKLVKYVYDMIAPRMEEAANDGDQATLTMLKRMQDKIMAICIPLVVSTQKSWEEFQMTMTVKITKQHLEFAKLMFEVLYACEDYLFGQTWQEHYENEERDIQPRITYRKTSEHFNELPSEFTTDMFMKIWGYSSNSTASTRIKEFVKDGKVEPIEGKRGCYKKLATAV